MISRYVSRYVTLTIQKALFFRTQAIALARAIKLPPFKTIIQAMSDLEPYVTLSHDLSTSASKSSNVRSKKTAPLLLFLEEDRRLPILAPLSSSGKKKPARHEMLSVQPKTSSHPSTGQTTAHNPAVHDMFLPSRTDILVLFVFLERKPSSSLIIATNLAPLPKWRRGGRASVPRLWRKTSIREVGQQ
jgi:hypothetical protein